MLSGCSPGRSVAVPSATTAAGPGTATGASGTAPGAAGSPASTVPRPDHIVVAVFENHGYDRIVGSPQAPYLNSLATQGALLTDAHGITHPSQPNYVALFSGTAHGIGNDGCPRDIGGTDNLGSQLLAAGLTFAGYSEGMPGTGYRGC